MAQATPLLDSLIARMIEEYPVTLVDRRGALMHLRNVHDCNGGLFSYAKAHDALVNNSAEEINIQFYTAFNAEIKARY